MNVIHTGREVQFYRDKAVEIQMQLPFGLKRGFGFDFRDQFKYRDLKKKTI